MKVIVITGASSGIGHATALAFARRGDAVVLVSRSLPALEQVANEIEIAGGRALPVPADVANFDDVLRVAAIAVAKYGRIDVWINNAAVAEWGTVEQVDVESIRRILDVDLMGTIHGIKAVLPHFRQRGGGHIINVASALSDRSVPLLSTYCAAKAGVKAFSDSLRMELLDAGANVAVTVVLPASINTPFYTWGPSRLGVRPHPISVIYPPSLVANAIVAAVDHPRREVFVGTMAKLLSLGERFSPVFMDAYMLQNRRMFREQYSERRDRGESNLFASPDATEVDGDFTEKTSDPSLRKAILTAALTLAGVAVVAAALRRR